MSTLWLAEQEDKQGTGESADRQCLFVWSRGAAEAAAGR
jgi:hypothetical protein